MDHHDANKLMRYISQAAKYPDMPTAARIIQGQMLDLIVRVLSKFQLEPSPGTTARFGAMFATLTTQMVTHDISLAGVIPKAAVKSTPPFTGTKPRTALHQVSNKHGQCKRLERDQARGGGSDA